MRLFIEKILNLPEPLPASVKTRDVFCFVLQKGLGPFLRGILNAWRFKQCGFPFYLGHDTSLYFANHMSLGKKVFIGAHSSVQALSQKGVVIGDHVRIRENTWILCTSELHQPGVGVEIGNDTYIGPYCYLGAGGGLWIGKDVLVGAFVQFLAENHKFNDASRSIHEQGVSRRGIKIGDGVWIGNHAIIVDGVEVGAGSVIGAGSVVTHDVPPNTVVAGNPAKVIRKRE